MKGSSVLRIGGFWLATLVAGSIAMLRYDFAAGNAGQAPIDWPATSALARQEGRATLVMVAHPQCPCTVASLDELAAVLAENPGRLTAFVVFLHPELTGSDWTQTASCRAAAAIPGVQVLFDRSGLEARLFGGETSGDVMLYDARGRLAFHGGITAARGKAGPNTGHTALTALLAGAPAAATQTPVFGCPLEAPPTSTTGPR
jgi:hypothetical protein